MLDSSDNDIIEGIIVASLPRAYPKMQTWTGYTDVYDADVQEGSNRIRTYRIQTPITPAAWHAYIGFLSKMIQS